MPYSKVVNISLWGVVFSSGGERRLVIQGLCADLFFLRRVIIIHVYKNEAGFIYIA